MVIFIYLRTGYNQITTLQVLIFVLKAFSVKYVFVHFIV